MIDSALCQIQFGRTTETDIDFRLSFKRRKIGAMRVLGLMCFKQQVKVKLQGIVCIIWALPIQ